MSHFIKKIEIEGLFNEKNINWELKKVNVLVGKNGLGKSTILRLIESTINKKEYIELSLCKKISIDINNGKKLFAEKNRSADLEVLIKLLDITPDPLFKDAIEILLDENDIKNLNHKNTSLLKKIL